MNNEGPIKDNAPEPGWKEEAHAKMRELEKKVPVDVPKDVRGNPLKGRPSRLSRQASKINLAFDKIPVWSDEDCMDGIYEDYQVNVANIMDEKARPTFHTYLIGQVMPTLTKRYTDLMNSCMHHEVAIDKNRDIAPLTRVEAEKVREILDKTTESVIKYLRTHGCENIGVVESSWKSARNFLAEVFKVLPSGERAYRNLRNS